MTDQTSSYKSISCPYLGLSDDPKTNTDFPYVGNACHAVTPPTTIDLAYQENCWLKPSHLRCPGVIDAWEKGFPKSLRGMRTTKPKSFSRRWLWMILTVLIVAFLLGSYSGFFPWPELNFMTNVKGWINPTLPPSVTLPPTRTATSTITLTSTEEPTLTSSPTASPTETQTPTKSTTPTETPTTTNTKRPYTPPTNTKPPAPQPTNPPTEPTSRPRPTSAPPTSAPPPTNTSEYKETP